MHSKFIEHVNIFYSFAIFVLQCMMKWLVRKIDLSKINDVHEHLLLIGNIVDLFHITSYSHVVYNDNMSQDDDVYSTFEEVMKTQIIQVRYNKLLKFLMNLWWFKESISIFTSTLSAASNNRINWCKR
jgi:hypothetical protein